MELTTLLGMIAGFACIVISILLDGDIMSFVNFPSIFVTVGGTLAATVVAYPARTLASLPGVIKNAFFKTNIDLNKDIEFIISIANIARKEGLLALENAISEINNPFLKKGIMLIVDGSDPALIRDILETELACMVDRHSAACAVLEQMSAFSPAFGMAGTLIGLINMLQQMEDASALGSGMAVAMITTFYGVLMANLIFTPLARKLQTADGLELLQKQMILEGLMSIQDGENPRIIQDKLNSFIARSQQRDVFSKPGEAAQGG